MFFDPYLIDIYFHNHQRNGLMLPTCQMHNSSGVYKIFLLYMVLSKENGPQPSAGFKYMEIGVLGKFLLVDLHDISQGKGLQFHTLL